MSDLKTPLLDQLKEGPWPSFVSDLASIADKKPMVKDLLGQLEMSYKDKKGHWKHGGLVGVTGYGSGVIGRYSDVPDQFPNVAHFHTIRVNQPSGWFYTSKALRLLCDIWDKHGSGMTNMHGTTGDIIFLGTNTEALEPCFTELTNNGWDLGGSGSATRTPSCCVGPGRCEMSMYDTLEVTYKITEKYQDEIHRPAWPYKFKFKFSGCPNDCVAAAARSDLTVIGTWRDDIKINQAEVAKYMDGGLNVVQDVLMHCPTKCMSLDGKTLKIDNSNCVKCMHCLNVMPKALRPGDDKGATILIGAKAPIVEGALLSSVIVPFMKLEGDYDEFTELVDRILEFWEEHGMNRERIGELVQRIGLGNFLEEIELEPLPEMIDAPRNNPYIFYEEFYEEDDEAAE